MGNLSVVIYGLFVQVQADVILIFTTSQCILLQDNNLKYEFKRCLNFFLQIENNNNILLNKYIIFY